MLVSRWLLLDAEVGDREVVTGEVVTGALVSDDDHDAVDRGAGWVEAREGEGECSRADGIETEADRKPSRDGLGKVVDSGRLGALLESMSIL